MATFGGRVEANEIACMSALGLHWGANVSELEKSCGLTALQHAAAEGNVEVAKQVLENVGDV